MPRSRPDYSRGMVFDKKMECVMQSVLLLREPSSILNNDESSSPDALTLKAEHALTMSRSINTDRYEC